MKLYFLLLGLLAGFLVSCHDFRYDKESKSGFIYPAVPVITMHGFPGVWSTTEKLFESSLKFSNGKLFPLIGAVKVDDKVFRFMGVTQKEISIANDSLASASTGLSLFDATPVQHFVDIGATQTSYLFSCDGIDLLLVFSSPMLLHEPDLFYRPVNHISYKIQTNDGRPHRVQLYFEAASACCPHDSSLVVVSESFEYNNLIFMKTGKREFTIPEKTSIESLYKKNGDFYFVSEKENTNYSIGHGNKLRFEFVSDQMREHVIKGENSNSSLAIIKDHGLVIKSSGNIMVAYENPGINNFSKMRFHLARNEDPQTDFMSQLTESFDLFKTTVRKCKLFDYQLQLDATRVACRKYATICSVAYRHALQVMIQPSTIESLYLSAPMFLYYNADVLKGMLQPYIKEAEEHLTSNKEIGVDDAADLLLLCASVAFSDGDLKLVAQHDKLLDACASFLLNKTETSCCKLSSEDRQQSEKLILALASYAKILKKSGDNDKAEFYQQKVNKLVNLRIKQLNGATAIGLNSHHLIWQEILNISVFPEAWIPKMLNLYDKHVFPSAYFSDDNDLFTVGCKTLWLAALSDDKDSFCSYVVPLYELFKDGDGKDLNDKYESVACLQVQGSAAAGGLFIKMLNAKK
ncbi:MAG: DUF5127 domain-containing protein [Paludibacter sp.]|nr:DUF5127 domain-containing protein [Paludibacter sp.]